MNYKFILRVYLMKYLLLLVLLFPLLSALSVDFECPKEVYLKEDFECRVFIEGNLLSYDLKLNLKGDGKTINQIWEGQFWQRSDWYAKNIINSEEAFIRLRINKPFLGESLGNVKIRNPKTNSIVYEEDFKVLIKEREKVNKYPQYIVLNSKDIKREKFLYFKDSDFLKYSGIVLLGIFIGTLYLYKNKNGRKRYKEDTFGNDN